MNLVNFLGWEHENGIYRSKANGQLYRVVDNRLEIYDPDLLEWGESTIPINMLYKLRSVEEVGFWSEGFKVQNKEDWELVKYYYSQKGYEIYKSAVLRATEYLENNTVFYASIYYGKVEITTSEELVKRDLVLKPIDWRIKFYTKHARRAKLDTTSLFEKEYVAKWHSADVLDILKDRSVAIIYIYLTYS